MNCRYDRARRGLPARALLFLCALLWSCAQHPEPPLVASTRDAGAARAASSDLKTAAPAQGPLVVFLGDSLAAGLHLPAEQAFPAVVRDQLAREGIAFRLVNAGVSGDTSAGGLGRVGWIMKQKPRVVVLELGTNDGLRGLSLSFIEQNLSAIIQQIQSGGAEVLFLGMRLPPSFGGDYADAFAALYERVAKDKGVAFVPFFHAGVAGVPELNLPDGLHPTEEGHRRIAAKLAPHLREVLARVKSAP